LSLTATAAGQYCYLPAANAPTDVANAYILQVGVDNVSVDWYIYDYSGGQLIGTVYSGDSGTLHFPFTATSPGGIKIVASGSGAADFDNFSLVGLQPKDVTDKISNTLETEFFLWDTVGVQAPMVFLLTERPLQAVKFYVVSGGENTTGDSATWCRYWCSDGYFKDVSFLADGTTDSTVTMAQTGTYSFASTVSDAEPLHFNGLYLYCYVFRISPGSTAQIYHITVDAPFQEMKDIWDGVYRPPIAFQYYNASKYEDFTYDVNYESPSSTVVGAVLDGLVYTTDHIIIVFQEQTTGIFVKMFSGYVNTTASVMTLNYWNGSSWVAPNAFADGSDRAGKTLNRTGLLRWVKPSDEVSQNLFNRPGYAYKLEFSATLSGTKGDADYDVVVDMVYGVPAQQKIIPAKFPAEYLGRALLCGHTAGKEGNRIDFSMPGAPLTFNGEESSRNNTQSIYVSGMDDLVGSVTLTNRYGASIIGVHVLLKKTETHILFGTGPSDYSIYPISYNTGCIAPKTIFTAEVAFGVGSGDEAKRNICGWLSHDGPVIFDGTVIIPISGIDKFFDPSNSDYLNLTYAADSVSYFNATEKVWNLIIPSSSTATDLNKWLCFDLGRPEKGWFEKVPAEYPQAAWPVIDSNGGRYNYGGIDSGYMVQLDTGTSWAGTAIDCVIETGDFGPSGNVFDQTNIDEVRVIAKRTDEDADLTVKHYSNTATSGAETIGTIELDYGTDRLVRDTIQTNKTAWLHRMRFETSTDDTDDLQLIGWAFKWAKTTEDPK
jgi:hypothetical protein